MLIFIVTARLRETGIAECNEASATN